MKWTVLVFSFLLMACGETTPPMPEVTGEELIEQKSSEKQEVKPVVNDGFPRLNNTNVEEFLLEYGKSHPQTRIRIKSDFGDIEIELFEDTPLHRANFVYLINRGYYTPTEVIRVIKGFMIQGGNSEEEGPAADRMLIGSYCLPAEMGMNHVHHRGALAMSRNYNDNPDKCSSAYDFYIVQGTKYKGVHVFKAEQEKGIKYNDIQKQKYKSAGGAIHLDMEHTVFGHVVKGMNVIDEIAKVEVDGSNWPKKLVQLSMEVVQ